MVSDRLSQCKVHAKTPKELTELMTTKVDPIIGFMLEQLEAWGHTLERL